MGYNARFEHSSNLSEKDLERNENSKVSSGPRPNPNLLTIIQIYFIDGWLTQIVNGFQNGVVY